MFLYNLGQLFTSIATQNSNRIAIVLNDGQTISYQKLDKLSNDIAVFLIYKGFKRGDVVAIFNNKTEISFAIMIACLKIGVIYTNLDHNSPLERFKKMIEICKPYLFFYFSGSIDKIKGLDIKKYNSIEYSDNKFWELPEGEKKEHSIYMNSVTGNTPAYIMFTSGSTGFPKGVVITHANVLNLIEWAKLTYEIKLDDIFTNLNPMHFDNSVFDFYASLFTGASIIPVSENLTRNPRKLLDYFNITKPTIWFSVPSMLVYMLKMRALKEDDLRTLKIVTFGGEGFPKNQLRNLWKYWGKKVKFINVYGPTECTCICSSYLVSETDMVSDDLLPLGPIAPNFYTLIVDENQKIVKEGEMGELCIGGPNVGLGYFNNPEKTKEMFIENPYIKTHREFIYKSGDIVKFDSFLNSLIFCGRKDNQIKRMGYRIELEEIETAIGSLNYVSENAVVYINNSNFSEKIIACISTEVKDEKRIIDDLFQILPTYMIPDLYFFYEQLPKNQNGKIDRLKIKENFNEKL